MKKLSLSHLSVGVIGLARSGIAAANLARSLGARVLISDVKPRSECSAALAKLLPGVEAECGGHSDRILSSDLVIKSPGVHHSPLLDRIRKTKIPVWSEIELALRAVQYKRMVAITGTNGKTTTTTLTGEIFRNAGGKTVVGGNIGEPPAARTREIDGTTTLVLEVSSYQLEDSTWFSPDISAVLNVTPDHLEHHKTMKNYAAAKARIFSQQTKKDFAVLNYDDIYCRRLARKCPARVIFFSAKKKLARGVFYSNGRIHVRLPKMKADIAADLKIPGMHNIENALAAVAISVAAGIRLPVIEETLASFPGVEHRIELTRELDGVRYYNDSKGTNVDSTRVALESFTAPVWLILGGRDKGSPYTPLKKLVAERVKGILLIGEAAPLIKRGLKGCAPMHDCGTMAAAVKTARKLASPGEVVLLSPACASFDQFTDYEDRGRRFKELARKLR